MDHERRQGFVPMYVRVFVDALAGETVLPVVGHHLPKIVVESATSMWSLCTGEYEVLVWRLAKNRNELRWPSRF
jgi:hypothetical protein